MISWSDRFSVGVKTIDEQHRKLVETLSELHEAMKVGKGKDVLLNILEFMLGYTKEHFSTEEQYMEKYSYPGTAEHKSQHRAFVNAATNFYTRYHDGSVTSIEIYNFLQKWLVNHILNTDKKLGKFLSEVV